ncbi:phage tail protein [Phaeobacter gallaeciensis]|uniref:phage tail protein n=1 Tax=Phaeobacter gallaeciensis TaxID=60890 RepID=UPI0023807346|nr:phage tail protein [Phaeobacter gallaeciensis]MDE4297083.1 phage tail protein [Phaeobacter gallaeciensis]
MALTTFTPPIPPSPGTKHAPQVNVLKAEFGDGYTQAAPNGLNHIKRTIALRWDGLTEAQYDALDTFFNDRGGFRPFWYQPRGHATALKWVCEEWSGSDSAPWAFEAKLEQWFGAEA